MILGSLHTLHKSINENEIRVLFLAKKMADAKCEQMKKKQRNSGINDDLSIIYYVGKNEKCKQENS